MIDLRPQDTHALRRTILRDGTASDAVVFDGDELPTTLHLGVLLDGEIVAISTWLRRDHPDHTDRAGVQLRGMATAPGHRGTGISAELLAAGVARCRAAGVHAALRTLQDDSLAHGGAPGGTVSSGS